MKKLSVILAAVICAGSVVLSGCGDNSQTTVNPNPETENQGSEQTPDAIETETPDTPPSETPEGCNYDKQLKAGNSATGNFSG